MKKLILVALAVVLPTAVLTSHTQARVFKTYEEYTANTGETYGIEYFSLDINSELHVLSNGFTTEDKKTKKELTKLKELYPSLSGLFDCIYKKSPLVITPEAIQNRGKDGRIDYHPPKAWYLECFKALE